MSKLGKLLHKRLLNQQLFRVKETTNLMKNIEIDIDYFSNLYDNDMCTILINPINLFIYGSLLSTMTNLPGLPALASNLLDGLGGAIW